MECRVCRGTLEERLITYVQRYKARVVIVENVPAEVCDQCGEELLRAEVVKRIQKCVWEGPISVRGVSVPVYDLANFAAADESGLT